MIERGTGYRGRIVEAGVTGKIGETRDRGEIGERDKERL